MNTNGIRGRFQKLLPSYAVISLTVLVISNLLVYYGARVLNIWLGRPYLDMTGAAERLIPVIPAFSIVYVIAFPFWYVTYFLICRSDRQKCIRLVTTDVAAKLLCGILFVLIPTTNVRPEVTGSGLGSMVLGFIYTMDSPDNLFPSVHCLESWICFQAIREEEKAPSWLKASAFFLAVFICFSTLFTKQHVIADVVAGVLIADAAWGFGEQQYVPYMPVLRRRRNLVR